MNTLNYDSGEAMNVKFLKINNPLLHTETLFPFFESIIKFYSSLDNLHSNNIELLQE